MKGLAGWNPFQDFIMSGKIDKSEKDVIIQDVKKHIPVLTLLTGFEEKIGLNYYENDGISEFTNKRMHKIQQKDKFKKDAQLDEAKEETKKFENKNMYIEYRMIEKCDLKNVLHFFNVFKFDFKKIKLLGQLSEIRRTWDQLLETITADRDSLFNTLDATRFKHIKEGIFSEVHLKDKIRDLLHNNRKMFNIRAITTGSD